MLAPVWPRHSMRHWRGETPPPLTPPNSVCTREHQHCHSNTNEQYCKYNEANRISTLHFLFEGNLHTFHCAAAPLCIHTQYTRSQTLTGLHTYKNQRADVQLLPVCCSLTQHHLPSAPSDEGLEHMHIVTPTRAVDEADVLMNRCI